VNRRRSPAGKVAVVALLVLVAASCRRTPSSPELGMQRIALSLSFSEEALKVPVPPEVIIRVIPAPPQIQGPADLAAFQVSSSPAAPEQPPVRFDQTPPCPVARPGTAPKEAAQFQTFFAPAEGVYRRVNKGTISVVGGVLPLKLPYPPQSTWTVRGAPDRVTKGVAGVSKDTTVKQWTIERAVTPTFVITDHLSLSATAIQLSKRVTTVNGVVTTFTPAPAIDFYTFGVEGKTWTSAGIDSATKTAMYVSGKIQKREIIDACGELIDTYQFTLDEQVVDLATGGTSGTPAGEPNVYNIAPHIGGLLVKEDVHVLTTTRTESGAPLSFDFDYTSVFKTLKPAPLGSEKG